MGFVNTPAGQVEFEYLVAQDARLRAHISQRSNLKYVKTVMDHFDEQQCEDFRNSPPRNKLWFNVQGHLMRFGLQEYALVTRLRCGLFQEGDDFDRLIERKRLKERFRGSFARKFQKAKRRKEKEITCTVHGFPIVMQLYVYATLRPTDTEVEQPYFSTLVSYDDPLVPVLDDMARTIHAPQFHSSHAGSGVGGQSGRQDLDDGVHSGESGESETSEDDDSDGQLGSDRDSDDSDDIGESSTPPTTPFSSPVRGPTARTRPIRTSASSLTRGEVEELLLDQRILFEMRLRTVKLEIQ
ncbi:Hypothetical predicted protein [Olea europaea subsp. europaea]|uniref:Uncharacterized protein n=1 Tax=Olea europaea subsp. europaea TaxID=158383 RepID=A0A8S0RZS5_OLEEU|nr:Hypothetical predicted protein [Olea europaea subsp. europaea]